MAEKWSLYYFYVFNLGKNLGTLKKSRDIGVSHLHRHLLMRCALTMEKNNQMDSEDNERGEEVGTEKFNRGVQVKRNGPALESDKMSSKKRKYSNTVLANCSLKPSGTAEEEKNYPLPFRLRGFQKCTESIISGELPLKEVSPTQLEKTCDYLLPKTW